MFYFNLITLSLCIFVPTKSRTLFNDLLKNEYYVKSPHLFKQTEKLT